MSRGLIEIAKAIGRVDICDNIRLFTNKYLSVGRVVDLNPSYRVRIKKNNTVEWPFIFVVSSVITPDERPYFKGALDEEMAIIMIEALIGKEESDLYDNKPIFPQKQGEFISFSEPRKQ